MMSREKEEKKGGKKESTKERKKKGNVRIGDTQKRKTKLDS